MLGKSLIGLPPLNLLLLLSMLLFGLLLLPPPPLLLLLVATCCWCCPAFPLKLLVGLRKLGTGDGCDGKAENEDDPEPAAVAGLVAPSLAAIPALDLDMPPREEGDGATDADKGAAGTTAEAAAAVLLLGGGAPIPGDTAETGAGAGAGAVPDVSAGGFEFILLRTPIVFTLALALLLLLLPALSPTAAAVDLLPVLPIVEAVVVGSRKASAKTGRSSNAATSATGRLILRQSYTSTRPSSNPTAVWMASSWKLI
mmetsp:Transcript_9070/g.15072  ORF Transcript_9070/g.15072 Transcript_9070/m.15072 type:complete len:255 (+) Transcript_9070:81-845(+)